MQNSSSTPIVVAIQLEAARRLGLHAQIIDPDYGYLFEVSDGQRTHTLIGGKSPLNCGASSRLSDDKYYTELILRRNGFTTPTSIRCLKPDYFRSDKYEIGMGADHAIEFAERQRFPLVVKPNRLSHGKYISVVDNERALIEAIETVWDHDYIALAQTKIEGTDIRLNFLDGEFLIGYQRNPLVLRGDGVHTIRQLLETFDVRFCKPHIWETIDNDPVWRQCVTERGYAQHSVLARDTELNFQTDIMNLTVWAQPSVITSVPQPWLEYGLSIGKAMNLRHFGIDLKAKDLDADPQESVIIEVNASPVMVALYRMGYREESIEGHKRVLQALFAEN